MVTLLVVPAVGLWCGCRLRVNVDHGELQRSDLHRQTGEITGLTSLWIHLSLVIDPMETSVTVTATVQG